MKFTPAAHRRSMKLSQREYAARFGVPVRTLQKWEQKINPVHPFFEGHVRWLLMMDKKK